LAIAKKKNNMDEVFTRMHKIAVTHDDNGNEPEARRVYNEILQIMRAGGVSAMEIAQFERAVDERMRRAHGT
jgi:hypothetical protein